VTRPRTSARLARALAAEAEALTRERERLTGRRDGLRDQLAAIEDTLAALDDQLALLGRLGPVPAAAPAPAAPPAPPPDGVPLRGAAVRETAVRLLAHHPEGRTPIHHRRWSALLTEAGFRVEGKDPLAVFLTQVTRSPLVRRAGAPGAYALDRTAPDRLRRELAAHHAELRALTAAPAEVAALAATRARRDERLAAIAQTERALEEAVRSLRPLGRDEAKLAG
jgi:hypothetical protein